METDRDESQHLRDASLRFRRDEQVDLRTLPMGDLFKRLSADSTELFQQELHLAKLELRESVSKAIGAGVNVAIALVLLSPGLLAVTAAIIIGLGSVIGSYWVSALMVGVVILAVAGILVSSAIKKLKSGLAPDQTAKTVQQDLYWAKKEAEQVKERLSA